MYRGEVVDNGDVVVEQRGTGRAGAAERAVVAGVEDVIGVFGEDVIGERRDVVTVARKCGSVAVSRRIERRPIRTHMT